MRWRLAEAVEHQAEHLEADRIRLGGVCGNLCGANERRHDLIGDTRWQRRARRVLEGSLTGFEAPHRLSTHVAPEEVFVELLSLWTAKRLFELCDKRRLQARTATGAGLRPRGVDASRRRGTARGPQQPCIEIELIGSGDELAAQVRERVGGRICGLSRRRDVLAIREHGDSSLHAQGSKGRRFAVANRI